MKKNIRLYVITFTLLTLSQKQSAAQSSGTSAFAVNLVDIVALTVSTPAVAFTLSSAASYATDQTQTLTAQLLVTATRDYDLAVKANTTSLAFGGNTIPLSVVKIEVANNIGGTNASAVTLTNADQQLTNEASAGVAKAIDMKYTLLTNTNVTDFNKPSGAYITTLTYTASID